MRVFKRLAVLGVILVCFGCNESGVIPESNKINGKVVYSKNPVTNMEILVDGKRTLTNSDGTFSLEVTSLPYDLVILRDPILYYKGLNNLDPYIEIEPELEMYTGNHTAYLNLIMPPLKANEKVFTFFIPDANQEKVEVGPGANLGQPVCFIEWRGAPDLIGTWVTIQVSIEGNSIVSFDKYYERRNVNIHKDDVLTDTITENDPFIQLGNSFVRGSVINPYGNYQSLHISLLIYFPNILNTFSLQYVQGSGTFDFILPFGIPHNLKYFINAVSSNTNPPTTRKILVHPWTENNMIQLYRAPELVQPINGDSVNLNSSIFNWSPGDGEGVYVMTFRPSNFSGPHIKLYTSGLSTVIPDLSNLGVIYPGNGYSFVWNVRKYHGLSGMDNFTQEAEHTYGMKGVSVSEFGNVSLY